MRCLILLLLLSLSAVAKERPDWETFFAGVPGTVVLVHHGETDVYNPARAEQGFIPASTYKVPHSLIALETGVVRDGHEVLPWDGVRRQYAAWNRDHILSTAMKYSVVPVYQRFARAIGEARMRAYLEKIGYGNANIDGGIDRFWLDGQLRISAHQQIDFLRRLYADELPFRPENQLLVKTAMLIEATPDYVIRAKTGYENGVEGYGHPERPGVGWWVGWVERDTEVIFFALNLDISNPEQLGMRQSVVRAILRSEGYL
ncbi:MAG: class D beta-lactamase [Candidatus Eremiobacteraeota bacterium]|nr:class D beta-lactamase [Candidatus Eremiobacteraeota bacterium]